MTDIWDIDGLADCEALFEHQLRISTTDRGAPNLRHEASARHNAAPTEVRLHVACDVHKASTVTSAQHSVAPHSISNLVAFAIAQRPAGSLDLLRTCIAVFLQARLVIHSNVRPPDEATSTGQHRRLLMDLFLPATSIKNIMRRATISGMLNGNWSDRYIISHYCPPGCCSDNPENKGGHG